MCVSSVIDKRLLKARDLYKSKNSKPFFSVSVSFHGSSLKSCFSLSISLQAVVFDGEEQAFQSVINGKASFMLYHNI